MNLKEENKRLRDLLSDLVIFIVELVQVLPPELQQTDQAKKLDILMNKIASYLREREVDDGPSLPTPDHRH